MKGNKSRPLLQTSKKDLNKKMSINQTQFGSFGVLIQVSYHKNLFPFIGRRPIEGESEIKKCILNFSKISLSRELFKLFFRQYSWLPYVLLIIVRQADSSSLLEDTW